MSRRPLDGVRVLELGQLLAGPWAATMLAYFGADVIKVEPPGGDPIRTWRVVEDGTSLWWRSLARNKRSVVIDLRHDEGRALVKQLAATSDVLIENFRPGTMEQWGLGPDDLRASSPRLVYARVSGFGQTGPHAHRPGYASVAEAVGGLRSVTGFPDRPPARANVSLGDSLAGIHAALGIVMALYERDAQGGTGQTIDVALTESIVSVLESMIPEADRGVVRERAGTTVTGIVPSNTYPTRDGKWVVIGANSESNFQRLMRAIERPDLEGLRGNPARVARQAELDEAIATWTRTRSADEIVRVLEDAAVPAGPIQDARDLLHDPQLQARGMLEHVEVDGRSLTIPAIAPKLDGTPGRTEWPGGALGAHTREVLRERLAMHDDAIDALVARGVIAE
ncbi:CaiB/BaiF CoA transferase family protein [Sandaracinus amylolyticus]|uniref:L-carnitine dehydratase/bile acid-inducible protein F n=1 Tax=Sandaracinus amylolyticus TaxID=927083 RepID=A0A0F6W5E5_9BACT|nr:CaiB/BaiF CoA-transferase family protein [Sandaracinus amylolyticus]AKF07873.1 L-carnitine dehydratase/bile acid-inducible protein F [Sandaracinus amylolyticus]